MRLVPILSCEDKCDGVREEARLIKIKAFSLPPAHSTQQIRNSDNLCNKRLGYNMTKHNNNNR